MIAVLCAMKAIDYSNRRSGWRAPRWVHDGTNQMGGYGSIDSCRGPFPKTIWVLLFTMAFLKLTGEMPIKFVKTRVKKKRSVCTRDYFEYACSSVIDLNSITRWCRDYKNLLFSLVREYQHFAPVAQRTEQRTSNANQASPQ